MNKKVQFKLDTSDTDLSEPVPIEKFRKLLDHIVEVVPDECLGSIVLEFSVRGYDDCYCELEAYYERPETELEAAARVRQEEANKNWQRSHDLRRLAELKAKYESGES